MDEIFKVDFEDKELAIVVRYPNWMKWFVKKMDFYIIDVNQYKVLK